MTKKLKFRYKFLALAVTGLVLLLSFFIFTSSNNSSPDEIIFPTGYIRAENHADYGSYLMFIEHPDFNFIAGHPNPSFPQEVNSYLEKMHQLMPLFNQYSLKKQGRVFPVVSEGKELILVAYYEPFDASLTLVDPSLKVLDTKQIYGPHYQYFASANFRDRLWIKGADGGNQGYNEMVEIRILNNKIVPRKISWGDRYFEDTYKIIHPSTDPEMKIHQRKEDFGYYRYWFFMTLFTFPIYIIAFFNAHRAIVLSILSALALFILWKLFFKDRLCKRKNKEN
jgi:hypothetical protein